MSAGAILRGASVAFLLGALAPLAAAGDEAGVYWKGRFVAADELPDAIRPSARAAVTAWAEWAKANEYRLDLEDEGRVLLGSPSEKKSQLERWRALEARTIALFEELLPAPPRADAPKPGEASDPPPAGTDELPEDPDGAPAGFEPSFTWSYTFQWGSAPPEPDADTAVLFVLRNEEAQGALLGDLARRFDYLVEWTKAAHSYTGFVLEQPMMGAYLLDAAGQEEWNPDNELVNRLTQLLVLRRFGRQPYAFVQGLAWVAEQRLCGAIYCFPYRNEFVWATEHTSWESELAKCFQPKDASIPLDDLLAWNRGKYQNEAAQISFGLMRFLVQNHGGELPAFLEELRVYCEAHSKIDLGNGNWQRDLAFRVPEAELERMLADHFGADVLEQAAEYLRAGLPAKGSSSAKGSKPSKPSKRTKPPKKL